MIHALFVSCAVLLLLTSSLGQSQTDTGSIPKPAVAVSFERQNVRESDNLFVDIWISNEADVDLSRIALHVALPDFIKWRAFTSLDKPGRLLENQDEPFVLGPVAAHSVSGKRLCISSEPNIKVGDFNILFIFEYQWTTGHGERSSFVTIEKSLKANLFGSETIAGVPMALAGFIVPGLFFWLVARWFQVPGSRELPLGDKMIYSVLVSTVFVVTGVWVQAIDINNGIGVKKLGFLAGAGVGLGCLVGLACLGLRKRKAALQAAVGIDEGDDEVTMLRKILVQNREWKKPRVTIQRKDGTEKYAGSVQGEMAGGKTVLLGWCKFNAKHLKPDELKAARSYAETGKLSALLEVAREAKVEFSWDGIIEWKDERLVHTESPVKTWSDSDFVILERESEAADYPPLRIIG